MKVVYKYIQANDYPFVAYGYDGNDKLIESTNSNVSFDEAKEELINKLKIKLERRPIIIPEPEDIEL